MGTVPSGPFRRIANMRRQRLSADGHFGNIDYGDNQGNERTILRKSKIRTAVE
jgi:hypothetical protein